MALLVISKQLLNKIEKNINNEELFILEVTSGLLLLINEIKTNCYLQHEISEISVFLKQMISQLSLYKILKHDDFQHYFAAYNYCSKSIQQCITGFCERVSNNFPDSLQSGNFITLMDNALDQVYAIAKENKDVTIPLNICDDVLVILKEVLCCAYAVALVVENEDSDSVKGASQTVLDGLNSIKLELAKPDRNKAMCDLLVDSLGDNLCSLERKVNTAVLKLTLFTFTNYGHRLERLYDFCVDNKENHYKEEELEELIAEFDLHVDKIMQIAWFAVTCSTYNKFEIEIKDGIATMESLEVELVPRITTLLKDKSRGNLLFAGLLKDRFISVVKKMKDTIYYVMDPQAFSQVVQLKVNQVVEEHLTNRIKRSEQLDIQHLSEIQQYAIMLVEMIYSSIGDIRPDIVNKNLRTSCANITNVVSEIKSSCQLLLNEGNADFRIVKRCKILEHEIRKLRLLLAKQTQVDETQNCINNNLTNENNGNNSKLELRNSNSNLDVCKDLTMGYIKDTTANILINRSVLYRKQQSNNSGFSRVKTSTRAISLLKYVHLRNIQFSQTNITIKKSHELEDILNDISTLSRTLLNT